MGLTPHFLLESGTLTSIVDDLNKIFIESVNQITKAIPVTNVDIVFCDNPRATIPEIGIGGTAYNSHLIVISLNPNFPEFSKNIKVNLTESIAHELHHVYRWNNVGYGTNLLEALVTEGLAIHFGTEISHNSPPPWSNAITDQEKVLYLKKAKKEFHNTSYDHRLWFFGSINKHFPKWVGYTLGYQIVGEYLRLNPNETAASLAFTKAAEFVKYIH